MAEAPWRRWRCFPWFVLRSTGFAFERLAGELDRPGLGTDPPPSAEDWSRRLDEAAAWIRERLDEPRLREALWVLDPELEAEAAARAPGNDEDGRLHEERLLRTLQRLAAQNYATGFCGPIAAGRLDRVDPLDAPLPTDAHRRIHPSQWLLEDLLDAAARGLQERATRRDRPRRAPGVVVEGDAIVGYEPGGRGLEATGRRPGAAAAGLVARADGERADADLVAAAEAAGAGDPATLHRELESLRAEGWLQPDTRLPAGSTAPLAEARARLARQPPSAERDGWIARLDELDAMLGQHATTSGDLGARRRSRRTLQARIEGWLGGPLRREGREMPPSHGLFHEQAERTAAPVGLPEGWAATLDDATRPYLELCRLPMVLERQKLRAWLAERFGDPGDEGVAWREVLATLAGEPVAFELAAPPEVRRLAAAIRRLRDGLRARIDAHLEAHGPEVPCTLTAADVAEPLDEARELAVDPGTPYANPDLMLHRDGEEGIRPILAEAHHRPMLTGCLLASLSAGPQVLDDVRAELAALCAPAHPAWVVPHHHSFVSMVPDVGQLDLELTGASPRPPERRAPFAELRLVGEAAAPRFRVRSHAGEQRPVVPMTRTGRLHHAAPVHPVTVFDLGEWLAGPDWRPSHELPRLAWERLVVHRRCWRLEAADWHPEPGPEGLRELARRTGGALPRFTFLAAPHEPKPFLVDWANARWSAMALRHVQRASHVVLTEMLPDPTGLWLRSEEGWHTSELRTVFYGAGVPSGAGTAIRNEEVSR